MLEDPTVLSGETRKNRDIQYQTPIHALARRLYNHRKCSHHSSKLAPPSAVGLPAAPVAAAFGPQIPFALNVVPHFKNSFSDARVAGIEWASASVVCENSSAADAGAARYEGGRDAHDAA